MIDLVHAKNQKGITIGKVLAAIDRLAPPDLAEEWDRIGLQIGKASGMVNKVLLSLDVTSAVITEAADRGCQLIISHHPLIFGPVLVLIDDCPEQFLISDIIRHCLSLIVAHTNLDAATGGIADCLAARIGLNAVNCEVMGKFGRISREIPQRLVSEWLPDIRNRLGSAGCRINTDQDRIIASVAVFPGSFPEEAIPELAENRPDLVICGEIKHHVGLMMAARGIAVIDAGHDVTERVVLQPLAAKLSEMLPEIEFAVARDMDYNKVAF